MRTCRGGYGGYSVTGGECVCVCVCGGGAVRGHLEHAHLQGGGGGYRGSVTGRTVSLHLTSTPHMFTLTVWLSIWLLSGGGPASAAVAPYWG